MSSVRRLLSPRTAAAFCALGTSALLLTACAGAETTRADVAAAAPTSPSAGTASPTGATTSPSGTATGPSATSTSLTDDRAEREALVPKAKVTWDKAADTAVKEVSGGKLTEIELTRASGENASPTGSPTGSPTETGAAPTPSAGSPVWAAEVAASDGTVHEVHVDAVTGKVFRSRTDSDQSADDKSEIADRLSRADRTPEQAAKVATDKTDGTVTAVKLDENDDQRLVWMVDVVTTGDWNKTIYAVDAGNGKILGEDVDRD
ncbi:MULTISPECIES: PepSY domain-containing protein [Streptomyces]|uniref:Membrane protein YkoI n=1 Tax=Streptomyces griseoviridis TaxID=45398 RepID=A0ABT9L7Y2_STRGD|nr:MULTISPECIES: PepSY domain-containing protein [Streptomyces]MDP9679793.1 putative membrane protein YkoI [Streptomyces griseoviridis]